MVNMPAIQKSLMLRGNSDLQIWKYNIELKNQRTVDMPEGAEVVHVGHQGGIIYIWVLVNPKAPVSPRSFSFLSTGTPIPPEVKFISTVIIDNEAWHVFEDIPNYSTEELLEEYLEGF